MTGQRETLPKAYSPGKRAVAGTGDGCGKMICDAKFARKNNFYGLKNPSIWNTDKHL
jgi:hypothetical protein